MSAYYLEHASVEHLQKHFDFFEAESRALLASGLAIPAYVQAFSPNFWLFTIQYVLICYFLLF